MVNMVNAIVLSWFMSTNRPQSTRVWYHIIGFMKPTIVIFNIHGGPPENTTESCMLSECPNISTGPAPPHWLCCPLEALESGRHVWQIARNALTTPFVWRRSAGDCTIIYLSVFICEWMTVFISSANRYIVFSDTASHERVRYQRGISCLCFYHMTRLLFSLRNLATKMFICARLAKMNLVIGVKWETVHGCRQSTPYVHTDQFICNLGSFMLLVQRVYSDDYVRPFINMTIIS